MQVYADNAATTRMHQKAIDTMTYHLNHTFGNPSSLYTIGQQAKEVLETARANMAACFGAQPSECVGLEDSFNGLKAVRASGAFTLGLSTTNSAESIAPYSDYVIPNYEGFTFAELEKMVEKHKS